MGPKGRAGRHDLQVSPETDRDSHTTPNHVHTWVRRPETAVAVVTVGADTRSALTRSLSGPAPALVPGASRHVFEAVLVSAARPSRGGVSSRGGGGVSTVIWVGSLMQLL